jgi:hypothetical protein
MCFFVELAYPAEIFKILLLSHKLAQAAAFWPGSFPPQLGVAFTLDLNSLRGLFPNRH